MVKLIPNLVGMSVIPRLRHLFLALKAAMSLCRASKSACFFTCPPPQAVDEVKRPSADAGGIGYR